MKSSFWMRTGLLASCVLLMLLAVSCQTAPTAADGTSAQSETETEPLAEQVQVIGFLREDAFPQSSDFCEWLTEARNSVQIDYAVFAVAEGNCYRCYLYSAVRGENDAVRVGYRSSDGVLVLRPELPDEQEQGEGSDMLFCFTVDSAELPRMEILVDGDSMGFRYTYVTG